MYQNITIIGRLGRYPEKKYLLSGDLVTSFSVATDRTYQAKGGQVQKETTWFRVSVFGSQAENCNVWSIQNPDDRISDAAPTLQQGVAGRVCKDDSSVATQP